MHEHLYFHWPFCKHKCAYCDFISFEQHESFMEQYHQALCNEVRWFASTNNSTKPKIQTLFFGGGSPNLYPLPMLEQLFTTIRQNFSLDDVPEITIEVNPGDVTIEHLQTWKNLGINRLSIGVQLLDETILATVNRHQTNDSVYWLLDQAPRYFKNISVDLMIGLPGTTQTIWLKTLDYLTAQTINHISVYFLTVYEKTPLAFKLAQNKLAVPAEDWLINTYESTVNYLAQKNFLQYEISNFAKPTYASLHNKAYWNRKAYKGFGLSAASFTGTKRLVNTNNLVQYLDCLKLTDPLINPPKWSSHETLTPEQANLEELMLGLRQNTGVDLQRMVYFLNSSNPVTVMKKLIPLMEKNLIVQKDGRIFLTVRGMVLENEIVVALF